MVWSQQHRDELPPGLVLTCGGWFGHLVGDEKRAPRLLRRSGLEWIARVAQAPPRLGPRYAQGAGATAAARAEHRAAPLALEVLTGPAQPPGTGPVHAVATLHGGRESTLFDLECPATSTRSRPLPDGPLAGSVTSLRTGLAPHVDQGTDLPRVTVSLPWCCSPGCWSSVGPPLRARADRRRDPRDSRRRRPPGRSPPPSRVARMSQVPASRAEATARCRVLEQRLPLQPARHPAVRSAPGGGVRLEHRPDCRGSSRWATGSACTAPTRPPYEVRRGRPAPHASDLAHQRVPWISFKLPYSWAEMAAGRGRRLGPRRGPAGSPRLDGPVWVAFHHEPEGDGQDITHWTAMQERLAPIVRSAAPNVAYTVILTGWNQFYGPKDYSLTSLWPRDTKIDLVGLRRLQQATARSADGRTITERTRFKAPLLRQVREVRRGARRRLGSRRDRQHRRLRRRGAAVRAAPLQRGAQARRRRGDLLQLHAQQHRTLAARSARKEQHFAAELRTTPTL